MKERSPFDDARLYEVLFRELRHDVPFYLDLAQEAGGPVLEVACGTGRVLLPLLQEGIDIDGIDSSAPMLAVLREQASAFARPPHILEADMRSFSLSRRYGLIFIAFNGFLHNLTAADQLSTLQTCRTHLLEDGLLAVDIFFPGLHVIGGIEGTPVLEHEVHDPETGGLVRIYDTRRFNRVEQIQRSAIEIQELDAGGNLVASHPSQTAIRWIYRSEIELLLHMAGFSRWDVFGGYDRRPLTVETEIMMVCAWK